MTVVIVGHIVGIIGVLQFGGLLLVGRAVYFYKEMESV